MAISACCVISMRAVGWHECRLVTGPGRVCSAGADKGAMGAGETENHSHGGGLPHGFLGRLQSQGTAPWLVGHLLVPDPRLLGQLAGEPLCCRTALEWSRPPGTHSQFCGRGPLLSGAPPLLLFPTGSRHTCPEKLALR